MVAELTMVLFKFQKNPTKVLAFTNLALATLLLVASIRADAHHGWEQVAPEPVLVQGEIVEFRPGNPHSELVVAGEQRVWRVELGQPWRNRQAGLDESRLVSGQSVTVQGHIYNPDVAETTKPATDDTASAQQADLPEKRLKAVRIILGGRNFDLYPNRIVALPVDTSSQSRSGSTTAQ